jgi:hypothetical protein
MSRHSNRAEARHLRVCHRRSHRHPVPPPRRLGDDRGRSRLFPQQPAHWQFRDRGSRPGLQAATPSAVRKPPLTHPSGYRPTSPTRDETTWHPFIASSSAGPRSSEESAPVRRTGPDTSFRFVFFWSRPAEAGPFPKHPPRSDVLKLQCGCRFGNDARAILSTIPRFLCGRRWITFDFALRSVEEIICRGARAGAVAAR